MKIRGIERTICPCMLVGQKKRLRLNNMRRDSTPGAKMTRKGAAKPNADGHDPLFLYFLQRVMKKNCRKPDRTRR